MSKKDSTPSDSTDNADAQSASGVGALLKASRERCGEELRDVANSLRIRYVFLLAIEEGRYEDLPGPAYASGFIRSYAEYLGLDADEVVRRFHQDAVPAVKGKSSLSFPTPVSETGVPRGAVIFVGVLLAIAAYGAWYVGTSRDGLLDGLVAPVPESMTEAETKTDPEPVVEAEPEVEIAPPAISTEEVTEEKPDGDSLTEVSESEKVEPEKAPEPAAPDRTSPPEPAPAPVNVPAVETKPDEPAPAPAPSVPEPTAEEPAPAPEPSPSGESAADAGGDGMDAPHTPRIFGVPEGDPARVVLIATMDSWIQVSDGETGDLVATRLLRAGDSYRVPDRKGLKLLTGNAGALEVMVDGRPAPSIGPMGSVRRNVALEPEPLRTGQASEN